MSDSYLDWSLATSSLKVFSASSAALVRSATVALSSSIGMAWNFAISAFWSSSQRSRSAGEQDGPKFSSANFLKSSYDRPPSYLSPIGSVEPVMYLMVGYPLTPYLEQRSLESSAVQSTSTMATAVESAKSASSFSQSGFIFLQCPHQGAWNLMKADFPAMPASKVSPLSETAEAVAMRAAARMSF